MPENHSIRCLSLTCERIGIRRGLCLSHYQLLVDLVRAKGATWTELETQGRCLAKLPRSRVWTKPFVAQAWDD